MDKKLANAKQERILWVDLEMTGLDANRDLILEIAAVVTDWKYTEIATFEGIVKHDDGQLDDLMKGNGVFWDANPVARDGLITQNSQGRVVQQVEAALLDFIGTNFAADKPVLLAGNSIHMDRRFITARMPALDARLHYRMLDVTSWKVVFENKFGKRFAKPESHRALDDIRGSIEELKYYTAKVKI
jgi:oligoribonuclease